MKITAKHLEFIRLVANGETQSNALNGLYIAKTGTSILFPYYFSNEHDTHYGILIFSKEYFMVKNKFKELRMSSKMLSQDKNKRYKFKKI